jgi:hypothetical protein
MDVHIMHASRAALVAALMLATPALAYGQAGYIIPGARAPRDPPPRFAIAPLHGAPGTIGLPLPRIGLGPAPHRPIAPNAPHAPRRRRHAPVTLFAPYAPYAPVWPFYLPQPVAAPLPPQAPAPIYPLIAGTPSPLEAPAPGRLVLYVEPKTAEVFADGYYIGVSDDFSPARGGALIEAGVHHIDISAPGHEPAGVDLRVTPGQHVTYRASLKPVPPPAAAAPTTFYLIPGCYMGNIPPKDAHLPDTCDQTRAVTWRP